MFGDNDDQKDNKKDSINIIGQAKLFANEMQ